MKIKKSNKLLLTMILLIFFADNVIAIGISPSRTIINFEPNLEQNVTYTVYNKGDIDVNVKLYVKGELEEYIILSQDTLLIPSQSTNLFSATVKLPAELNEPGAHNTMIGAVEYNPESEGTQGAGTFVGAITGVESQLYVQVPYPGKYASLDLEVPDVVLGKPINFKTTINNLGSENINSAYVNIDIFDPENNKITSIQTEETAIKNKESAVLYAYWVPKNVSIGVYRAVATLYYDGLTTSTEKQFKIGDLVLKLNKFSAVYNPTSKFIQFDIALQSLWNNNIDNVFGKIIIKKNLEVLGSINTETVSVEPWGSRNIILHYPAENYADGIYNAELNLKYADNKSISNSLTFEIKNLKRKDYLIYGAIIVLAIIVIILLIYYIIMLRGKNENK